MISLWCPKGGLFPQRDKKIYLLVEVRRARAVLASVVLVGRMLTA